jgi:hypothetical protein
MPELVKVEMSQPCQYEARVRFIEGAPEIYLLGHGQHLCTTPINDKVELLAADGRVISLNWAHVACIEFKPVEWEPKIHELLATVAEELVSSGRAKRVYA